MKLRTDFDIGDTYFKCVNKLSCFAYDEFKDVVLVNYYCNEENFDNVPESERKNMKIHQMAFLWTI